MTAHSHYSEDIIPGQPEIIDSTVSQIVESKVVYLGSFTRG
jgi:hypothetical protein